MGESESKFTEVSIEISDPLTLHHSDNRELILVSKPLDGHNYGQWGRAMRMGLSAKNKIGLIDGSITTPKPTEAKYATWKRCNDMVLLWIVNSVHSDIAGSILYTDTAAGVWNDLKDRFSQGNDSRIYQIRQEIVEHRQGQQSVSAYYTKMKALWDELASSHDPLTCTCEGLKQLAEREEKERVMQFLMGLNDSYATVRRLILMMSPLPDTRKVHALVLQQERQVEVASRRENLSNYHAMQTSRSTTTQGTTSSKKLLKYSYCDGGHLVDDCFYLNGFPVGHKFHGKNVKPKGKKPSAHNTQTNPPQPVKTMPTEGPTFTTEEYNQIMAMLRKGNGRGYEKDD
ncbi:uncharacterized protein [Pyrus communis]|uniref:uncharacterized protein n=1 Tax=Pyrus communis TaxID=23211 RepID=UPI0035BF8D18